jgi:hypothetical protein
MKAGTRSGFSFIEPMKALPVERLPEGDRLCEIKLDGYRALAFNDREDVRLTLAQQQARRFSGGYSMQNAIDGITGDRIR